MINDEMRLIDTFLSEIKEARRYVRQTNKQKLEKLTTLVVSQFPPPPPPTAAGVLASTLYDGLIGAGLGVVNGYYRVASATEDGRTHYIKLCNDARAVNDPASDDDGDGNGLGNNSSAGATALVEIVYGRH